MTTQESQDDIDSAAGAGASAGIVEPVGGWPELDKLVTDIKTKRTEELARQDEQRQKAQKAAQDAERAWTAIGAHSSLEELAGRLQDLGVAAIPAESVPGSHSAALDLTRLPKGEVATIRVDTTPSRNGPPRTTVQVQRGNQQLPATVLHNNTNAELRKTLVEVAQKLLG